MTVLLRNRRHCSPAVGDRIDCTGAGNGGAHKAIVVHVPYHDLYALPSEALCCIGTDVARGDAHLVGADVQEDPHNAPPLFPCIDHKGELLNAPSVSNSFLSCCRRLEKFGRVNKNGIVPVPPNTVTTLLSAVDCDAVSPFPPTSRLGAVVMLSSIFCGVGYETSVIQSACRADIALGGIARPETETLTNSQGREVSSR